MSHNYTAATYTISESQLEELSGEPIEDWHVRIWEALDARGQHYVQSHGCEQGPGNNRKTLHLPAEFPDGGCTDGENNDILDAEDKPQLCHDHPKILKWRYKTTTAMPAGFKKICSYCLHDFVEWHSPELVEEHDQQSDP